MARSGKQKGFVKQIGRKSGLIVPICVDAEPANGRFLARVKTQKKPGTFVPVEPALNRCCGDGKQK
jgi:hypothetical protein